MVVCPVLNLGIFACVSHWWHQVATHPLLQWSPQNKHSHHQPTLGVGGWSVQGQFYR